MSITLPQQPAHKPVGAVLSLRPRWILSVYSIFGAVGGYVLYDYGNEPLRTGIVWVTGLVSGLLVAVTCVRRPSAAPASPVADTAQLSTAQLSTIEHLRCANAELAVSEARFRAFFDHAEDSLCEIEVTPDGRFICLNINPHAEAVMGVSADAVRGRTAVQILGPEAGARITAALLRCVEQNGLRYEENWATVRGPRLTDTIMVPLRDEHAPQRPVVRILCSMRDITDRRNLEAQLAQGQKLQALGQLAGGIAHDFNNVLQAIESAGALIVARSRDPDAVARLARTVLDAATRGSSITRRLLGFARRDELRAEPVDAAALLVNLREVLASTLGAGIAVCINVPADLPNVEADKGLLETALVNLATNARDAMPQGGALTLNACADATHDDATRDDAAVAQPPRPGAYVRFEVIDSGHGMDPATLARAAEPFYTTKPRGQGTGLGLSMVRGFAEQSGGALVIASTPGGGTTVTFWLPQAQPPAGQRDAGGADAATLPRRATHVLVVDDDPLVREGVCEILEMAGYRVSSAPDAANALPLLGGCDEIDLLLTDFSMPGLNGVGLIREAQRNRPDLPALLMTGYAAEIEGLSGESTANARFVLLRKPVSAREILSQLGALLPDADPCETRPHPRGLTAVT